MQLIMAILFIYVGGCTLLHLLSYEMHNRGMVTYYAFPRSKILYYILSFTWGLPMNLLGALFALIMLCIGVKPKRHGWNYYFELNVTWGLELGIFFIAPKNATAHLKNHELGHSLQNIYYGPFTIGVISIPSAVRFWWRHFQSKRGMTLSPYDSVWFEGSATASGTKFMTEFEK